MISPRPPHCGQGWLIEKKPWLSESTPRPPQRGQTCGLVPGSAPLPPQVAQAACFGTVTGIWVPLIAWSKQSVISVSRSRPRIGSRPGPPPPPRLKIVEKMSPMSEVKPPGPAGPAHAAEHAAAGVVLLALLGVREHVVGALDLLEALLRRRVVGVAVGVVLARELAVGPLHLLVGRLLRDARGLRRGRSPSRAASYSATTTRAGRITCPSRR